MHPNADRIARKLEGFEIQLRVDRSVDIEADRKARNLGGGGRSLLRHAVLGYLLQRTKEADELAAKAEDWLRKACLLGEKPVDYERGYDEGMRSAALAYAHWLTTGAIDHLALQAAADGLRAWCSTRKRFEMIDAELLAPVLLYAGSYPLIREIAEHRSWKPTQTSGRIKPGIFNGALRIALAAEEYEREILLARLRKTASRKLDRWIERGHYDDVAYTLYALFPRPEGPPSRLIQECWRQLPKPTSERPEP